MGLLDKLLGYAEIKGPVFVKDFSVEDNSQINKLLELKEQVTEESKEKIDKELMYIKSGLSGEKNVYYELTNIKIPMYCLHDIRIEHDNKVAQFDFIIVVSEFILVLETKNLYGNISIDSEGNFNREYLKNNKKIKEGMYSPITQNERHIQILDDFLRDYKLINKCPIYSLVVIANEKTIVDKKYAKKEIKDLIIKHDQLIERIYKLVGTSNSVKLRHNYMLKIAEIILENHKPIDYDFVNKLGLEFLPIKVEKEEVVVEEETEEDNVLESKLHKKLKAYRFNKSKAFKVKPYYVFNNNEMEQLILMKPRNKEQFLAVPGFGDKKYELFGSEIISIIEEYVNPIIESLKALRLDISRKNDIKAYEVFTNNQLDQMINIIPINKNQLEQITGFKQQQIDAFGDMIIEAIQDLI